uniref:Uncharacterized protein n=1 Tax=Rhizophora mucronata TaxID=61149 RepID=A0A2P2ILQ9_RHIMU
MLLLSLVRECVLFVVCVNLISLALVFLLLG